MISLTEFLCGFFCVANAHLVAGEAGNGQNFEQRVARYLLAKGARPGDDYWFRHYSSPTAPVIRIFSGPEHAPLARRRYAVQWGICLSTPDRRPAPVLDAEMTAGPDTGPEGLTRRDLARLCRPLNAVYTPHCDGGWFVPRPPTDAIIDHILTLHDHRSDELWRCFDRRAGDVDRWASDATGWSVAA